MEPVQSPRDPAAPDPHRAAFEEAKKAADAALASGNPGLAAHLYLQLLERIPADHAVVPEAKFHRAQLLEMAGFRDVAIPLLVELARDHHDGAWKALDRLLEEAWASAREAPPGLPGRPAREALRALVERLSTPTPSAGPARAWLDTADVQERIASADQAYSQADYPRAAQAFEDAGLRARNGGLTALMRKALGQAAAVYWHNLHDFTGTLRVFAALGPAVHESPALKAIHGQACALLADDLRALVRRGDRKDAYVKLAAAFPLLTPGQPLTEELTDLYLRELASHHIGALDARLIAITRQASEARLEMASDGSSTLRTDPADAVAARLKIFALEEERERLAALRRALAARELAVLTANDPKLYLELLESSRESGALGVLLDRVRRLSLERMHYRVKLKSETKDALASLLPEFLATRLVDRTFTLIRSLELEVEALTEQFLDRAYPRPA